MNAPTAQLHSSANGRHIGEIFFRRVEELSARTFIKLQNGSRWEEISWRDFGSLVRNILLALYGLGLAGGESIAIIGENSLQRACADLATLAGGFPNVVIAPALSDSMLLKVLAHAKCRAAFVEDASLSAACSICKGNFPPCRISSSWKKAAEICRARSGSLSWSRMAGRAALSAWEHSRISARA